MGFYSSRVSGSDEAVFVGGVEAAGDLQTSGSLLALHNVSGSNKGIFVGGVEAQGDIQTSGSLYANHNISGSGKGYFVGGIEALGDIKTSGSFYASGSAEIDGFVKVLGIGNSTTISEPMTIPANYNSVLFGPITITETLTITSTAAVKIKDIADA